MRITILQGAFFPVPPVRGGAVEKIWHRLGKLFAAQGHSVCHISRTFPDLATETTGNGVRHVRVPGFDQPGNLPLLKLYDAIYTWRCRSRLPPADILVTHTFWAPLLIRNPAAGRIYVHQARYPKGQIRFYRRAARLQAVSEAVGDAMRAEAPALAERICVIPNPVDVPDAFRGNTGRENCILYAGRLHPEKGCHLLVRAFRQLVEQQSIASSWKLRFIGPWKTEEGGGGGAYFDRLEREAAPVSDRIEIVPPTFDRAALDRHYDACRLFVYPSLADRGESFGLAPLEAMARSVPVMVSDLACFREFLQPGTNGMVFDHRVKRPEHELAVALRALIRDDARLETMARNAYKTAGAYRYASIADRYLTDFQMLTDG